MASLTLPIVKWIFVIGTIGRVCLVIVSAKIPGICKIYHIYDLILLICDFSMVQQTTVQSQYRMTLLMAALGFIAFHYNFRVNMLCVFIVQIKISLIGALLYKDEDAISNFFINLLNLMLIVIPASFLIDRAFLEYSEIRAKNQKLTQSKENQEILIDNFDEGLLILNKEADQILYAN